MAKPKLVGNQVRREYDRLARQIMATTLREASDDLERRYGTTLDAFSKALNGAPYPGANGRSIPTTTDHASSARLLKIKSQLADIAKDIRVLAANIQPPRERHVA
jgi:hypothetical protein